MNKKAYAEAKKSHYNVKVVTDASHTEYFAKVKAEEKAEEKRIASKADLYGMRKNELEYSIDYHNKYIRTHAGSLESGWNENCESHFSDIETEAEALKAIAEDDDLKQLEKITARFETCADWLACKPEDIEKPIECELWHFCRKQNTKESIDCMVFSKSGRRQNTERYRDYKQECLMFLFERAINNPSENFQTALYESVKDGMYSEWSKYHRQVQVKKPDGTITTKVREIDSIDKPLDMEESESATIKDALPDTLAKPLDFDLIQAEKCEKVIVTFTRNDDEERTLIDLVEGYNLKESAFYAGREYKAVTKQYERLKARANERVERWKTEADVEAEARKAKAEAKRIADSKAEMEARKSYHKTEVKPEVKPYEMPDNVKAFERMINRPMYYMSISDGSRKKATYVTAERVKRNGKNTKRIKHGSTELRRPEAIVSYVEHEKPEAKAKFSSYFAEDDKINIRIAEADARKAEALKWETKNASYCKKAYAGIGTR